MRAGVLLRLSCAFAMLLAALLPASSVRAEFVYFKVGELPGQQFHNDSFVLPLSDPTDIAHARDLITKGPEKAGATIVFADIAKGSDGINRNLSDIDQPLWSWHVTQFNAFGDFGIELIDGWPTFVEQDVSGWIKNTNGQIGFWNYTVVGELGTSPSPVPEPIPLTEMLHAGFVLLAMVVLVLSMSHRTRRA